MKTACFIPVKSHSERIPGKNFREVGGRKLYEWICMHALESGSFSDIYVDTDSAEIAGWASMQGIKIIKRLPELASNDANGNDLLVHHRGLHPEYDLYFQLFATAPFLKPSTIRDCVAKLAADTHYDSVFTAVQRRGFFWMNGVPVNYRPGVLPRSQDLPPVLEETTGLYGIRATALDKYRCRIGARPMVVLVGEDEAVDINNPRDLAVAQANLLQPAHIVPGEALGHGA